MTKEAIIKQIEKSFNEYTGSNEAIDDAAFYIAAEFDKAKETLYTEEQVIKIVEKSRATGLTAEYIMLSVIKNLKQIN
jgi:hypothetical protein